MLTTHCCLQCSAWHARGLEAEHHVQHTGVPTGLPVAKVAAREVVRALLLYHDLFRIVIDDLSTVLANHI